MGVATVRHDAASIFDGSGEMRARCRAFDWSSTPLGPVEQWSTALRTSAGIVLASGFPSILVWGDALVQIYNDAYIPLIGAKHPSALGEPTHETWPELRAIQEPVFARVYRGETVTIRDALYRLSRHDGGDLDDAYFTASFVPVRLGGGGVGGSLSTLFETTAQVTSRAMEAERARLDAAERVARRAAERHAAELEAVIESIPDAVYIGNANGMTQVNRRALEQLGVSSIDALRGSVIDLSAAARVRDARTGEIFQPGRSPFARALAGERIVTDIVVWDRAAGADRILRVAASPIVVDGTLVGAVAVNTDITDQRRGEDELRAAVSNAEQASRAKTEFLAVMSHELRTPLNAIGGYAELLAMGIRGPITDQQREDLERIQRSQLHLLGLINEVLNYAKIETGSVRYVIARVLVRDVILAAESLVAPQAAAKRLTLTVGHCPPDLAVRADDEKLRQILVNLLSNAVKFTEPSGLIDVTCTAWGGSVCIAIRDTGIGIGSDKLDAIFEPFVQVNPGLTRTAEGTGLGLAISRDLARGMNGDLVVESTPTEGSVFTLTLPAD